jgi:hypothetical protein
MKKQVLFMVVLLAIAALFAGFAASNAFAYAGGWGAPCGGCHGTEGAAPTVTLVTNNGTTATYTVSAPGAHEWGAFNGNTRVDGTYFPASGTSPATGTLGNTATAGTFTVPVGVTYTIYAEYHEPPNAAGAGQTTVTPQGVTNYTITPTAGANGSISPNTPQSIASGSNVTFTITPATGYVVDDVLVNGASVGALTTYTFTNVTANGTISATFKTAPLETFSILASAGDYGTIAPTGEQAVAKGEDLTFAITPAAGYYVDTLTIDGTPVQPVKSYTFTNVSANHTIVATFAASPALPTITASVVGTGGTFLPNLPIFSVAVGGSVAYYFLPDAGYHVESVTVDGWPVAWDADDDSYTFEKVDRSHTLSVQFARTTWDINASVTGGGTIAPTGTQAVPEGESAAYTITPNAGSSITDVVVDGQSVGIVTSYTFEDVTEGHTIQAKFAADAVNFTITASVTGGGSIMPFPAFVVPSGGNLTFYFLPNDGFQVASVSVDGAPVDPNTYQDNDSYVFSNVTANHAITVAFAPVPTYTITPTAGAHGSISPATASTVTSGDDASFTVTPDEGYYVQDVKVDGASVGAVTSYTFTEVTANHTIEATFAWTKLPTSTTLKASAKTIRRNGYIRLTATLRGGAGFSNTVVRFQVKIGKKAYKLLKNVKVNSKGVATYRYKVTAKGTRYHRVKFLGNATYLPAPVRPGIRLVVK